MAINVPCDPCAFLFILCRLPRPARCHNKACPCCKRCSLGSSDKLSSQPRFSCEPHPRAQGFAPRLSIGTCCGHQLHYCTYPGRTLPCCIPSPATWSPSTDFPLPLPCTSRSLAFSSSLTSTLQIMRTVFHQCFLLNPESLLLLYTPSASSWYHI